MRPKLTLLALLVTCFSFAQDLFIGNNTYLYSRDVVLTVTKDIRLDTPTSNIYLRGDAQLYQIDDIKNSDAGELSIYQNQTTGIYEYNFWCSPVGISVNGTTRANVSFQGNNSLHDPQDHTDLTNVTSSPYLFVPNYNGTATQLSDYWIYTLENGEGYFDWNHVFESIAVAPGLGFTLKGSPNPNNVLDFRGRPNNGTITVSCAFDGTDDDTNSGIPNRAETLTGNPYPSALDLKLFFVNSATNQANLSAEIYFWEQVANNTHVITQYEGGYGMYVPGPLGDPLDNGTYTTAAFERYNLGGGTITTTSGNTADYSANNSRRFAAVGQGFVVSSNGVGGNFEFTNDMRVYLEEDSTPGGDGSIFAKTNKGKKGSKKEITIMSNNKVDYESILNNPTIVPEIRIHTRINDTYYKESVIAFRSSTPNNKTHNRFYDGINIHSLSSDAYLLSENQELSIKSINYNEVTRIPFGLKAEHDDMLFSAKINTLRDVPSDVNIYIFDNLNGTYTDIKNGAFEITLDEGIYNNRFEVTFSNKTLDVVDTTFNDFNIFQNNSISELKVVNPSALDITSFNLFDVAGKAVLNQNISEVKNSYTYSTKSLSDGVYIARIRLKNNQGFTKKVVISNKN